MEELTLETFIKVMIFLSSIIGLLMYLIMVGGKMSLSEQDRIDEDNEQSRILSKKEERNNKNGKNLYK